MFLFKNLGENEAPRIIQKLFLFFKKAYKVKAGKKVRGKSKRSGSSVSISLDTPPLDI